MAAEPLCCRCDHHHGFPNLLSVPSLFGSRRMRTCLSQGRGLVNNLACLLGDQVGLRARIGAAENAEIHSMTTVNDLSVRRALENAGVEFIDENGGGPG